MLSHPTRGRQLRIFHIDFVHMPQNSNRAGVTAVTNDLQQLQILAARPDRKNLLPLLIALGHHAVERDALQIRFQLLHYFGEVF